MYDPRFILLAYIEVVLVILYVPPREKTWVEAVV